MNQLIQTLDEIEAAAEEATPGPWESTKGERGMMASVVQVPKKWDLLGGWKKTDGPMIADCESQGVKKWEENANYIALANPATILALTQALRLAVEALRKVSSGDDLCPHQPLILNKVTANMTVRVDIANDAIASITQLGIGEGGK